MRWPDRFREWHRAISILEIGRPQVETASVMREVLEVDIGFALTIDRSAPDRVFSRCEEAGANTRLMHALEPYYADGRPSAIFSIDAPQRTQRNRVVALGRTGGLLRLAPS